jgi:SAM-dependent methyltransferase
VKYDPIKNIIGKVVRDNILVRRIFYELLGLMFLREWHVKRLLKNLLSRHSGIVSILDAGSGFGQYSYFIARKFPQARVQAVDVKEDQINDCREFFRKAGLSNAQFAIEDLTTMSYDTKFDLILSVDVMEHIVDDEAVFQNFFRALKNAGALVINTPASGEKEPGKLLSIEDSFIGEHVRFGYTPDEMREKLVRAGFTVERIAFTYGRYGSIAWKLGIKIPMMIAGIHKLLLFVLPLYYAITFPFTLLFMYLDYSGENQQGGGLLVLAWKR